MKPKAVVVITKQTQNSNNYTRIQKHTFNATPFHSSIRVGCCGTVDDHSTSLSACVCVYVRSTADVIVFEKEMKDLPLSYCAGG
jgi:hypothetical protein